MEWIINNKEWLFGGVLVVIPTTIIGWFFLKQRYYSQRINAGKKSINIQLGKYSGRNLDIRIGAADDRTKDKDR